MIAESIYAQVYSEGNDTVMVDFMVYYKRNEHAMTIQDHNILVKGMPSLWRYTVIWFICIQWNGGLTSWEKLYDMK